MGELTFFLRLHVKQKEDGIFISQDKYVTKILKKFGFTDVKTASIPMETQKPLLNDEDGEKVDVHLYRSMIGSLMYLTSSRPSIMFAVCACARYQVNPKVSHLHVVKRIFSLDRKSTTRGCQFLGCRLISWKCKKQTVVANSTTEAEYVAASSCCGQVLWIQNQLLDYGSQDCKHTNGTQKPMLNDEIGEEVDVHMYRSMIGSLMYLTSSKPDIMFAVCACARYQVNPKVSHLHAVKRIFRYLKGQTKLGLWYPKDSPFDLVAYTDSDYAGASLDRKSTTGGCQFLGSRLISWQCKKQTVVANSTTEAEYVAASKKAKKSVRLMMEKLVIRENRQRVLVRKRIKRIVAFMAKPAESEGFEQIVDFLNANPIRYALTINLTIYTSCIEQFWDTVKAKNVNGEVQLQALVDGKKVIVTEASVRRDLQLDDEEGTDCFPNATIFEELTRMGAKTTAWNEFSSTMASAIIYLVTNQKFNFSKYIFESMVKNLDNAAEMGEGSAIPTDPHHTPIEPSTSQPQKKQRSRRPKRKDTEIPQSSVPSDNVADEAVNEEMDDSLVRAATTATGLDAEQDSGNINKTQSKAPPNEPSSPGTSSGGGPKRQETIGDTIAQTGFENISKLSNDLLLARGNTL
ncbi:hypothetical protein Tco_0954224 [Tanacetum coccineum]|uniref:Reverse transcriptase Ty1/copia-type domain-containing protein n=1 Tax=Tanacetum coccineum TaxID=301880 RepID=A0ABQ5E4C1_9ASTR